MSHELPTNDLRLYAKDEDDSKRLILIVLLGVVAAIEHRAISEQSAGHAITWPKNRNPIARSTGYSPQIRSLVLKVGELFDVIDIVPEAFETSALAVRIELMTELKQLGERKSHDSWLVPDNAATASEQSADSAGEAQRSLEAAVAEAERRLANPTVTKLRGVEALFATDADLAAVMKYLGLSEERIEPWLVRHKLVNGPYVSRLLELELENSRLKHIIAEQSLELAMWKGPPMPGD